jgi:hypothetical protein
MRGEINRALVGILLLAASTAAAPQKIYRSVGPDGKVLFSDKPDAGSNAAMVTTAPASAAARATGSQSPPVRPGPDTRQKQGYLAPPGPNGAPRGGPPPAVFESALPGLTTLGSTQLHVDLFEDVCGSGVPESARKYRRAAGTWRDRHTALLDKYNTFILSLSPDQHRRLATENLAIAARPNPRQPAVGADQGQLRRRCDETADEIMAGRLDRFRDASVIDAVKAIEPR